MGLMGSSDGCEFSGMRNLSIEMGFEEAERFSEGDSSDMYSRVKLRASGRVFDGRDGNLDVKNVKSINATSSKKSRVSDEGNSGGICKEMEGVDSAIKIKKLANRGSDNASASKRSKLGHSVVVDGAQSELSSRARKGNGGAREGHAITDYNFLDPKSDEGVAVIMLDALREGRGKTSGYEYVVGDLVWGKVGSHPWWPGQIFDEAFASTSVSATKRKGHVLVSFYGDNTYAWLKPADLIPFNPNFAEKSNQTDTQVFVSAIKDAMYEIKRRATLGLACQCQFLSHFRPTNVQGFLQVDLRGYEPGGLYSLTQIKRSRDDFQPSKTLSFIRRLALVPQCEVERNVTLTKNAAQVLAYRAAVFAEFDETYAQAFGVQPVMPIDLMVKSKDQAMMSLEDQLGSESTTAKVIGKSKGSMEPVRALLALKKDDGLSKWSIDPRSGMISEFSVKYNPDGFVGRDDTTPSPGCVGRGALTAEMKDDNTKHPKVQREDEKKIGVTKDFPRRREIVAGASEPTMLVMKFLPETGLPSVSELKAKFGRFRSLNQSATHVSWKSSTCRVVFENKSDAQAAYTHAVESRILFGNRKVHYHLRALDVSELELLESGKSLNKEASNEFPPLRSMGARDSAGELRSTTVQQIPNPPVVQLKSCLKKPTEDVRGSSSSVSTETPHVQFMVGGDGTDKGGQPLLGISKMSNSVGDFPNDTNANHGIIHFTNIINTKYHEMEARKIHSNHTATATTNGPDISHGMLNLLRSCDEVVADVKRSTGYVPYERMP